MSIWGDFENHPSSFLAGLANLLPAATLTNSGTGDHTLALDWRAHTHFAGAAGDEITADFGTATEIGALGVLDPVGTLSLHWSDDNVTYTPVLSSLSATRVLFEAFTPSAHRYWRIGFTGAGAGAAVLWLGTVLYGPGQRGGFAPPEFADEVTPLVNLSQTGAPLGNRVERAPSRFQLSAAPLTRAQMESVWVPLRDHAKSATPFFLKWTAARPAAFCWINQRPGAIAYTDPLFMSSQLDVAAIVEGVTP